MISRTCCFLIAVFLLSFTCQSLGADVIKKTAKGEINWSKGTVTATGYGVATGNMPDAKKRIMARRAAQIDAYRNLAEIVNGVKVTSDTYVHDMVVKNDKVKTSVNTIIKGAAITSDEYENGMAIIKVTMPIDGNFMKTITPEIPQENLSSTQKKLSDALLDLTSTLSNFQIAEIIKSISPISYAHASDQEPQIKIQTTEQLNVAKQLLQMLDEKPKHQVLAQLKQQVSMFEDMTNFTGILVDARQVSDFELATVPKLRTADGKIIYPDEKNLFSGNISSRPVSYDLHIEDAVENQRIASKPIKITAQGIYHSRFSDLVIDEQSAELIKSHTALLNALEKGAVIIVVSN